MKHDSDLRREDGFAMYIVILSMMVLLTIGAALSATGNVSSRGINEDELGVRALQAAEAGAQAAVHRLNLQQPTQDKCITTAPTSATAGKWCAPTSAESVGNAATYRYQTSLPTTTGCTGSTFGAGTVQRCVVSTGTAGGVTRRVIQRVVSSSGANPFPVNGILGLDGVTLGNNSNVTGGIGSNGQTTFGGTNSTAESVQLWNNAPNPVNYSGSVTRYPTPFVLAPPDMLHPTTLLDSARSNDNGRLLPGASPFDSCSAGSGACYVNTAGSPRTLSVNGSVTLSGGVYNFCQVNLSNQSAVNIAAGARVLLYIDSPSRNPQSGCVTGQGGINSGNGTSFSNPSNDAQNLQIIIYGSPAYPVIDFPNNVALSAAIYAPNTGISFKNNGAFSGGISAKTVSLKNNATWDNKLANFQIATRLIYYRGAWRQCSSRGTQSSSAPDSGCL